MKNKTWCALFFLAPGLAQAHPGHDGHEVTWDFASGVLHPLTGWEHLLAALTAGLLAAKIGGRFRWFIPVFYLAALFAAPLLAPNISISRFAGFALIAGIGALGFVYSLQGKTSAVIASLICVSIAVLEGVTHFPSTPSFHPTQFFFGLGTVEIALQYSVIIISRAWSTLPSIVGAKHPRSA